MHSVKATLTSATHPSGGRARSLYERSRGFQPCGISFSQRHDREPGRFERSVRHDLFGVHVQGTGRVEPPRRRQRLVAAHEWRRRYSSVTAGACCRGSAQQPPAAVDILALAVPISPRSPSAGSSRGASGKRAYSSVCRSSATNALRSSAVRSRGSPSLIGARDRGARLRWGACGCR